MKKIVDLKSEFFSINIALVFFFALFRWACRNPTDLLQGRCLNFLPRRVLKCFCHSSFIAFNWAWRWDAYLLRSHRPVFKRVVNCSHNIEAFSASLSQTGRWIVFSEKWGTALLFSSVWWSCLLELIGIGRGTQARELPMYSTVLSELVSCILLLVERRIWWYVVLKKISRLGGLGTSKDFMEVNLKH